MIPFNEQHARAIQAVLLILSFIAAAIAIDFVWAYATHQVQMWRIRRACQWRMKDIGRK